MQVIAVERWTFWTAVLILVAGFVVQTVVGPVYDFTTGTTYDFVPGLFSGGLILFLVSVALGGSRDPSVRSLPPTVEDS